MVPSTLGKSSQWIPFLLALCARYVVSSQIINKRSGEELSEGMEVVEGKNKKILLSNLIRGVKRGYTQV